MYYPNDDQTMPFRPNAFAQQLLPVRVLPETWIYISAQGKRKLLWPMSDDFWHVNSSLPEGVWLQDWDIESRQIEAFLASVKGQVACISPCGPPRFEAGLWNHAPMIHWLNYDRAVKTDWEIEQITLANQRAMRGHQAAEQAFHEGLSEFEIHLAYLQATEQQQVHEPYGSIVALNEHAATLHYENKATFAVEPRTLLLDAGTEQNGYASDITRTFTKDNGIFKQLVAEMELIEQKLSSKCLPGTQYEAIHEDAVTHIAQLLKTSGICKLSVEEQIDKKIPLTFFPHGVGHLLGLQVHDAGGFQQDKSGGERRNVDHPFLRLTRTLAPGMVVTIEPGLYFIPSLIDKMVNKVPDHGCDLTLIQDLKPFGGIRVEDNVRVTDQAPQNLTRTEPN